MSNVPMRSSAPGAGAGDTGGAEARFDALVHAHYARLCNFALRFLGSEDVVELVTREDLAPLETA